MTREEITQLKVNPVEITFLDRGCIIKVGCRSFAFDTNREAMAELQEYVKRPIEIGKIYAPDQFIEEKNKTNIGFKVNT
jgi:hypothetical protein